MDPEPFCACGHAEVYHHDDAPRACEATEPDPRCSCAGYRPGRRYRPRLVPVADLLDRAAAR